MKKADPKFLTTIKEIEFKQKELKKLYRDPTHQPPHWQTYRGLADNKRAATLLYSAIAASRGRVHCNGWTLEQQQEFLNKNSEKLQANAA